MPDGKLIKFNQGLYYQANDVQPLPTKQDIEKWDDGIILYSKQTSSFNINDTITYSGSTIVKNIYDMTDFDNTNILPIMYVISDITVQGNASATRSNTSLSFYLSGNSSYIMTYQNQTLAQFPTANTPVNINVISRYIPYVTVCKPYAHYLVIDSNNVNFVTHTSDINYHPSIYFVLVSNNSQRTYTVNIACSYTITMLYINIA